MSEVIDCAIIGAGVAGTYCAWRLVQKNPPPKVYLFECTSRVGGRLLSIKIKNIEGPGYDIVDLGGMRYSPVKHKLFNELVKDLDLSSKSFQMGDAKDQNGDNNFAYFRGKHLRICDFSNSEKVPFNLSWSERGKTPNQLLMHVWDLLAPGWKEQNNDPKFWFNLKVFGKPLWEYGFWNLLYRVLTPEAFLFLKYGSGYDSNVCNGNAAALLPTGTEYSLEKTKNTENTENTENGENTKNIFRTLTKGMDTLPKALVYRFKKKSGEVEMSRRLVSISRKKRNYELTFKPTITEKNGITHDTDDPNDTEKRYAKHVILAMPRAALERIEWDQWKKNGWLSKNLDSVLMQEAFKMFLAYEYPWWRSLGLLGGRSLSDLPLRQTFYINSEDEKANRTSSKNAVLMASYSDIESAPFWKGLQKDEKRGRTKRLPKGYQHELFKGPEGYQATKMMVREADEQIRQIHDKREIPSPYAAACYFWGHDTIFGGGWHCWKAGYDYLQIWRRMVKPVRTENVYICGEAYSAEQGWCEGALESAEFLLTQKLPEKLRPEPFIKKGWRNEELMTRTSDRF